MVENSKDNSGEEAELSQVELREFVYLDSLSVNSLLASLYMSIPQDVERVFKESEEGQSRENLKAGIILPNLLSFGGSTENATTDRETNRTKSINRINDQYRFTVLHDALKSRNQIIDLTTDDYSSEPLNPSDVVKIKGHCSTDPLYRLITAMSVFEDQDGEEVTSQPNLFEQREEVTEKETASGYREQIYHGKIGLKVESSTDQGPFGMAVMEDNMWVDLRSDFLGPQEYTVLGRVEAKLRNDDEWDLIESFRVLSEMMSSDDAYQAREEILKEVFENERVSDGDIDSAYRKLLSEGGLPSDKNEEEIRETIHEGLRSPLDPSLLDKEDFVMRDGYIIDPIAFYW